MALRQATAERGGSRLSHVAFVVDLHELSPVGRWATGGRDGRCFEKPAPDARAAPPEAHESLISRKTSAEVPLTGLSFLKPIARASPAVLIALEDVARQKVADVSERRVG